MPAHLLQKVYSSLVFTPLALWHTLLYTCIPDLLKHHQPANASVDVQGFNWRFSCLSVYYPPACPLCLVCSGQWQHSYDSLHIFPLQTDEFWRSLCLVLPPPPCRPPFNCCFSYSCRQKVVFTASLPCVSVMGIYPAFCECMCVLCVCVRERVWLQWWSSCFYVSAKCGDGSASEGQPPLGFLFFSEEPNSFIWCWIFVICPPNYSWERLVPQRPTKWSPYQRVDMDIKGAVCSSAIMYCY